MDNLFMKKMTQKRTLSILVAALVVAVWLPLGAQQETPNNLTDLLVSKGILTSDEVNQLAPTDPATEKALLDLLVSKGVITSSEAQGITPMAEPEVMIASTPAPAPAPVATVQTAPEAPKSTLVKAKETLKAVGSGLVDSGTILGVYTPADLPIWNYANTPFGVSDPWVGMRTWYELRQTVPALREEAEKKKVRILFNNTAGPVDLLSRAGAIRTAADIQGKKVRATGGIGPLGSDSEGAPRLGSCP